MTHAYLRNDLDILRIPFLHVVSFFKEFQVFDANFILLLGPALSGLQFNVKTVGESEHIDGPSFHLRDLSESLKLPNGANNQFLGYSELLLRFGLLGEPLQVLPLQDVGDASEQVNPSHEPELILAHVRQDVLFSLIRF